MAESPVGAALIGAGNVVRALYLPALRERRDSWRVVTVFDVDRAAAEAVARVLNAGIAPSLADAVADARVRAVFVCIPKESHGTAVRAALAHGRHVLCEKPLGRDGTEATELYRLAERAGVAHMVNFSYRFRPGPAAARRLLRAGALGELYHMHGALTQGGWFGADGRPSGERPDATAWRFGPAGGVVTDLGPHLVDFCEPLGTVTSVQAWTRAFRGLRAPAEEAAGFTLGFAGGAVAQLLGSRWATGHRENLSVEVAGSVGTVTFNRTEARVWTRDDPGWRTVSAAAESSFLDHFHNCLTGTGADVPTFRDGARTGILLDAVLRSARSGRVQTVPDSVVRP
jgi:predicted dehydrogenase